MTVAFFLSAFSHAVIAQSASDQPYCGVGYGNGVMSFLTPEQRMMHFADVQRAVANLSPNDMRSYRSQLRDTVMAMMPLDRKQFADDLTAKWKALPPEQKAKLRQDFTTYRNDGRWGGSTGMRQGKSMGGCWW
jgi:Spy/CpxP family protein refolding chaperone